VRHRQQSFGTQQANEQHAIHNRGHRGGHQVSPVPWPQAYGHAQAEDAYDYGGAYSPLYQAPTTPTMGYQYGATAGIYGPGYARCVPTMQSQQMGMEHGGSGFMAPVLQRTNSAQPSSGPRRRHEGREENFSRGAEARAQGTGVRQEGDRHDERLRGEDHHAYQRDERDEALRMVPLVPRDREGRPIGDFLTARPASAGAWAGPPQTPREAKPPVVEEEDDEDEDEEHEQELEPKEEPKEFSPQDLMKMFESMMTAMGKSQADMMQFFGEKYSESSGTPPKCPLSTGEIEKLEGDLEPKNISSWWNGFVAGVKGKIKDLERILALPADEREPGGPVWSEIQGDERMSAADLQLAQAIMPCLKKGAGNVEAFKRRARRNPKVLESGFLLRNMIFARAGYRDPEEEDLALKKFKETKYYTAGMDAAAVEEATETLEDDLAALPSLLHEPQAQLQWMLRKMPTGASKEIADEHKLLRRELRRGQIKGKLPWDTDLLSRLIGCALAEAGEGEASAAEKGKGGPRGDPNQHAKRGCTNCGSPGHRWFENQCKSGPCSECGLAFCSKVHGKQCDAKGEKRPEAGKVRDALGNARNQTLVSQMQAIWDKDHGKTKTAAAQPGKGQKGKGKGKGSGGRGLGGRARAWAVEEEDDDEDSEGAIEELEDGSVEIEEGADEGVVCGAEGDTFSLQLDSGANCVLWQSEGLRDRAGGDEKSVKLAAKGTRMTIGGKQRNTFAELGEITGNAAPDGHRNLVGESCLHEMTGGAVFKEPVAGYEHLPNMCILLPRDEDGAERKIPIYKKNGTYHVETELVESEAAQVMQQPEQTRVPKYEPRPAPTDEWTVVTRKGRAPVTPQERAVVEDLQMVKEEKALQEEAPSRAEVKLPPTRKKLAPPPMKSTKMNAEHASRFGLWMQMSDDAFMDAMIDEKGVGVKPPVSSDVKKTEKTQAVQKSILKGSTAPKKAALKTAAPTALKSVAVPQMAAAAQLPHTTSDAKKWAARFCAGIRKLKAIGQAHERVGKDVSRVTKTMRDEIDNDVFRTRAQTKASPPQKVEETDKYEPGEFWHLDGYGPREHPDVIDKSVYQWVSVDFATDVVLTLNCKEHANQTNAFAIAAQTVAQARACGREPKILMFDALPCIATSQAFKTKVESELGVSCRFAPRGKHTGVSKAEQMNDVLTRGGEEQIARRGRSKRALNTARRDFAARVNTMPQRGQKKTRWERLDAHGVGDLIQKYPPYTWGTKVVVHEPNSVSSDRGDLGRASEGELVALRRDGYDVLMPSGRMVHVDKVRPINEHQLIEKGLPSQRAAREAAEKAAPAPAPQPVAPRPAVPKVVPKVVMTLPDDYPKVDALLSVWWKGDARSRASADAWHQCRVKEIEHVADGSMRHTVSYEGWPGADKVFVHNLATDRESGLHPWFVVKEKQPAGPAARSSHAMRMRARADMIEVIDGADDSELLAAIVHQYYEDDEFECSAVESLAAMKDRVKAWTSRATMIGEPGMGLEASAVSMNKYETEVKNKDGTTRVIKIPKGLRGLKASPDYDKWMVAIQKAFDALLKHPMNKLRRVCDVQAAGGIIAPCVTALTNKVDSTTQMLKELDGYKARHAYDGARADAIATAKGRASFEPTSSTTCPDMVFQMQIGNGAVKKRTRTSMDLPNAYQTTERAESGAPPSHMHCPTMLPIYDADGELMCVEFGGTWTWGERPSGRAFQQRLHRTLIDHGCMPAENVPCLYRKMGPDGNDIDVTTIVDDLFITEKTGYEMTLALRAHLIKEFGGCKMQHDPAEHAGYEIYYDDEAGTISLSMAAKIEEAARQFIPEYAAGASRKVADLPAGAKLRRMLDELKMPPAEERALKLNKSQKTFQQVLGVMRFPEQRVYIEAAKKLHPLARVQAYPPPEAEVAAKGVLADMFDKRFDMKTFGGQLSKGGDRMGEGLHAKYKMGDGAPEALELIGDATHALDGSSVFVLLLTMNGAEIAHVNKSIHMHIASSAEAEAFATGKAGELVEMAHEAARGLGIELNGPTFVGTDNKANAMVGSGHALPSRMRHCLRRYRTFTERVARREVVLGFVPDPENPSDFMSKWTSVDKLDRSVAFAMNKRNAPRHPRDKRGRGDD
jgi:hypothetical protein